MADVPDVAIVNYWRLTPAEIKVWDFYCARRNKISGGWECADQWVANEMRMSRGRVTEARNGLEKKGWIKIMYVRDARYFVAPFFGFVVENSTYLDEFSTKRVENSTPPLKELPAQLPAKLPKEGTANAAPHAQQASPDEKSKSQSARKPAVAAPTKKRKSSAPRPPARKKPTEITIDHPAVQMIKAITKRFPPKDQWDRISREIGSEPDTEFFRRCYETHRGFGGKPDNFDKWLFEPNETKQIPQRFVYSGNGNGSGKPVDVPKFDPLDAEKPLDENGRKYALEVLRDLMDFDGDVSQWQSHYLPDDWAWLMENLKNV